MKVIKNVRDWVLNERNGLTWFLIFILLILIPVLLIKRNFAIFPRRSAGIPVSLFVHHEGRIHRLDLEEYLIGVVAAEMPAEFELEALKAQAVAARTLAIKRLKRFGGRGCRVCQQADFCDDPAESQAWTGVGGLKEKWGSSNFQRYYGKIRRAVMETSGEIITFNNIPIDAVFHSTCGVGTAAAGEIWNQNSPYLQSESCGFDRESARYYQKVGFTWQELSRRLKTPEAVLQKMKIARRSKTGRVLWLSLGKQSLRGEEFRRMLALNSTCFTWEMKQSGVYFTVIGYGHGVGMCQYGANGMAKQGWNYHRILQHYYRGVRFRKIRYE
jgi:stage II sporulation protein D